jgi:demethylmenaquinone methyltransferase / 2-methoxy-6-polyprenyl-1,4-benzoquinol methylase
MEYYDTIAPGYDELHEEEQRRKLAIIIPLLARTPHEGPVLDVGCGTGFSLDSIERATGKACVGIDPSQGMLDRYKGRQTILKASAERIPYPDEHFAACISVTAIQNFSDIPTGVEEMRRVTMRGGAIIISCLKKSEKLGLVAESVGESLVVNEAIEEEKDIIFCCERKD